MEKDWKRRLSSSRVEQELMALERTAGVHFTNATEEDGGG